MFGHFLFRPGEWLGAGQVTFSMSPDRLYFRAKWDIAEQEDAEFLCTQTVEIIGGERMMNIFSVRPSFEENVFDILLTNELLGVFEGTGVAEEGMVAWEFRHSGVFEGFEVYQRISEEEYTLRAEYLAADGARTHISGKIWQKKQSQQPENQQTQDQETQDQQTQN